jgi:hypothetical protein
MEFLFYWKHQQDRKLINCDNAKLYNIKRKFHTAGFISSMNDWLMIYGFTSRSRFFFHSYGDITIAGEGLQNLGL